MVSVPMATTVTRVGTTPRAHWIRVMAIGTFLVALAQIDCGADECVPGESRCDGAGINGCGSAGDTSTARYAFSTLNRGCGDAKCLDIVQSGKRVAVCTSTGAPDPRCPADKRGGYCLDAQTLLVCYSGYSSKEERCGTCVPLAIGGAFCSVDGSPNEACKAGSPQGCDQNSVVSCVQEWVTKRSPCGPGSRCVATADSFQRHAYCTTGEPCTGSDSTTCEGDRIRGCVAGQKVDSACDATQRCESYPTTKGRVATCAARCKVVESSVCLDP